MTTTRALAETAIHHEGVRAYFPVTADHIRDSVDVDPVDLLTTWLDENPDAWSTHDEGGVTVLTIPDGVGSDLDRAALDIIGAELTTDAELAMDNAITDVVLALVEHDVPLDSPVSIVDALDELGMDAHAKDYQQTSDPALAEYSIEIELNPITGRIEIASWCWDPTDPQGPEHGETLIDIRDLALEVAAVKLRWARKALLDTEREMAVEAKAAQGASNLVSWEMIAGMLDMPARNRRAAQQWVTRKLDQD